MPGLNQTQFRECIVRPALEAISLWSKAGENLIVGTGVVESNLEYIKQLGDGPAVSIFQIEPATYLDVRSRIIAKYPNIYSKVLSELNMVRLPPDPRYLIGNLTAATIFARLKYYLDPEALPNAYDYEGLAKYHKRVYNTAPGGTDITKSTAIFRACSLGYIYHY